MIVIDYVTIRQASETRTFLRFDIHIITFKLLFTYLKLRHKKDKNKTIIYLYKVEC